MYDGHKSHVSLGVIDWAKAHNIILFVLPAHTSHLLQPLDVGCFGPLSRIYSNSCHKLLRENHCKITRYNIGELSTNAYVKGLSLENLRSSFRRAGIYPLNKSPYPPQVYLPSTVCTQTMTDITTDKNDTEEHALDTHDMTDELNANTIPQTPIQTDRIDCSPPMDLSPDVTQMQVESPTKNLTPNILTHASADSPPMDLSPDIFLLLDDPDFMDIDRVDVTDNGQDNDVVQDGHKTASDRPIDKDMTNRPVYYYVFAVFTTLFYSKLRPTFEPDYSTLEQTSFFSKFVCTERDIP